MYFCTLFLGTMYQACFHLPPQNGFWYHLSVMCTRSDLSESAGSPVCGSQSSRLPCSLCCLFMLHPKPWPVLGQALGRGVLLQAPEHVQGGAQLPGQPLTFLPRNWDVTAPEFMCHRGVCCWHGLSASGGIRVRRSEHLSWPCVLVGSGFLSG